MCSRQSLSPQLGQAACSSKSEDCFLGQSPSLRSTLIQARSCHRRLVSELQVHEFLDVKCRSQTSVGNPCHLRRIQPVFRIREPLSHPFQYQNHFRVGTYRKAQCVTSVAVGRKADCLATTAATIRNSFQATAPLTAKNQLIRLSGHLRRCIRPHSTPPCSIVVCCSIP